MIKFIHNLSSISAGRRACRQYVVQASSVFVYNVSGWAEQFFTW